VHFLLTKHNTSVDQTTQDGWTALHIASWKDHLVITRMLIEQNNLLIVQKGTAESQWTGSGSRFERPNSTETDG
jgi:ankyrin repeat protein